MAVLQHIKDREPCPFLPHAEKALGPSFSRSARAGNDPGAYYHAALTCAQSLWLQGKPAQALLQLNHALGVELSEASESLVRWPLPYQALLWICSRRHEQGFLGNPVRHYQHLATRMSGPNKELREWRAWACFHLAESVLPEDEFPRDLRQIEKEDLEIPPWPLVISRLELVGQLKETALLLSLKS